MYKFENLQEFNNKYYKYLCDKNNNIYENKSLNLIHHIWRVVLQFEISFRIAEICRIIIKQQRDDGEWGNRDKHHNFGDTVVNIHRLLWSLFVLNKNNEEKEATELIKNSIKKSVEYIIENHDMHYNINKEFGHGMIDRLHYLMQTEYYLISFNKEYNLLSLDQEKELLEFWNKDINWMIGKQQEDGGWHEVDRVRSRVGTTSDAIRGIYLDNQFMDEIIMGIKYIINNQNIYDGYWDAGNIDKNTDALKALINTRRLVKDEKMKKIIDESIKNGTKWLMNNFENVDKLEENEYDLLTITIDFEKVIINNNDVDFV